MVSLDGFFYVGNNSCGSCAPAADGAVSPVPRNRIALAIDHELVSAPATDKELGLLGGRSAITVCANWRILGVKTTLKRHRVAAQGTLQDTETT